MKSVEDVVACVVDHGIFTPIARRLARDFKQVYYWTPTEKAFPTVKDCFGDGFDDIDRVDSIWDVKSQCDLFVFPDIGWSGLQTELRGQGYAVWGAGEADKLEISRRLFIKSLKLANLPVPKNTQVIGISALRYHLKDRTNVWIKASRWRGDIETFHWRSWAEDEDRLDHYAIAFGPYREIILFFVLDDIETDIEDGCDTWFVSGAYPSLVIHGCENKDKAFFCTFQRYDDLPKELRRVTDAYAEILSQWDHPMFFSTEIRITKDGTPYFIDPTCRAGSPPSQVMTEMIANYGEIIWHGANGQLVDPIPAAKFGAQALLTTKALPNQWRKMRVPDELEQWVKSGNCIAEDDLLWFPPAQGTDDNDIGWLVGIGDLPDEPITHLLHNIALLPDGVCCDPSPIANLIKEIQSAEEKGMEFTDKSMPEPEIVISDNP